MQETEANGDEATRIEDLPWDDASRVDLLCDQFERSWRVGRPSSIESFLEKEQAPRARKVLLRSLIEIEVDCRREAGEQPAGGSYQRRFSEHPRLVREALEDAGVDVGGMEVGSDRGDRGDRGDRRASSEPSSPAADPLCPLQFSDYELGRLLGATKTSTVYEAVQKSLGQRVAVKILRPEPSLQPRIARKFVGEAQRAGDLRHPDIVRVHGLGRRADDGYFIAMDLVDGIDLQQWITHGPVPPRRAAEVLVTVAGAVQHANERGIIHRDIKPANVLLGAGGRPVLTDFGLAKELRDVDARSSSLDRITGTPCYMAPEQADPVWGVLGTWTDVHGLGGLLYALLTGHAPFEGATLHDVLRQVLDQIPRSPRSFAPDVPSRLEEICMTCLRKAPPHRYPTVAAVGRDLREWLEATAAT